MLLESTNNFELNKASKICNPWDNFLTFKTFKTENTTHSFFSEVEG